MRAFDASDVVYAERVVPLIKQALDDAGVGGQRIQTSKFLPSIDWLAPSKVASALGTTAGRTGGPVAPGLHGTQLNSVVVKPGGQTLSTTQAVAIPAGANTSFDVLVTNGGENDEANVTVRLTITGAGKPINVEQRINNFPHGTQQTVNIPLAETPPTGQPVKITVKVLPVPGEKKVDNNQATYPAIFTH
jgi:hypothetical protein